MTHNIAEALYLGTRVVLLGKENPNASGKVIFELAVPDAARGASGYPRREEIGRMTKLIEDAAMVGGWNWRWLSSRGRRPGRT